MFDNPFTFQLITPERALFKGEACCVTAPGVEGSFQVLRSHAPLIAALEIGKITVRDTAGNILNFAGSGGFLEVKKNVCTLLAESAEAAEAIDAERARKAKERAEHEIQTLKKDGAKNGAEQQRLALRRAANRLAIAERK